MKYVLRNRSEILWFPRKRDALGQPSESQFSKMACKILSEHLVIPRFESQFKETPILNSADSFDLDKRTSSFVP